MKHQLLLAVTLLLASLSASAQQQDLQLVCTAGGAFQTNQGSLQWTLGEVSIAPRSAASIYWGEGFQQAMRPLTTPTRDPERVKALALEVYPNPSRDFVFLESKTPIQVQVYDLQGRPLSSLTQVNGNAKLDLRNYPNGLYLIYAFTADGTQAGVNKIQIIH